MIHVKRLLEAFLLSALTLLVLLVRLAVDVHSSFSSYQVAVATKLFDRGSDFKAPAEHQRPVSCCKCRLLRTCRQEGGQSVRPRYRCGRQFQVR